LLTTDRGEVIPSFFDPVFPGFGLGQFAGFISDNSFSQITVSSTANALYGMDDLVYASPVPEPSSLVLLSLGITCLGICAGVGKRIMFRSDFPDQFGPGVDAILDPTFLNSEQKADILRDNAARFFAPRRVHMHSIEIP